MKGLEPQVEKLKEQAKTSNDPYFLALVAGSLFNIGSHEESFELATKLIAYQQADGSLTGLTYVWMILIMNRSEYFYH